jgi:hypothetical protein
MAFRKKSSILEEFCPDIAILQECESKEVLENKQANIKYEDYIWTGKNKNKGLGIMTFNGYKTEILNHNKDFQYVLPMKIYKNKIQFFLLAVWTQLVNKNIYESYVVQATKAIIHYEKLLKQENIFIVGDFNSNAIWDNDAPKEFNHSQMIEILLKKKLVSAYHKVYQEKQGKETKPTLYFTRKKEKPYHVDYFFIKENLLQNIEKYEIGDYNKYINQSDHMPLFLTMKNSF